jgi:hypothetical protein
MTGPEHYKAAEKTLADLDGAAVVLEEFMAAIAAAQVHATLALAAATATARGNADPYDWLAWNKTLGGAT